MQELNTEKYFIVHKTIRNRVKEAELDIQS